MTRSRPLEEKFDLLLPDLPGFGFSPKPVVPYDIDLFVDSLRACVEEEGLAGRPLHVVGHSLGAILALEYAARFPENLSRMVLLSLPRFHDSESAHRMFWLGSPSYRRLLQQNSFRQNLSQLGRLGLGIALRSAAGIPWEVIVDARRFTFQSLTSTLENCLLHYSVEPALGKAPRIPTLLLHGLADQVAPFEAVARISEEHPHIALAPIAGAGHHVLHTHPRRSMARVVAHLEG